MTPGQPQADDDLAAKLCYHLASELASGGSLTSRPWREAFETVPRGVFVPAFYSDPAHNGDFIRVDGDDPASRDTWLRAVYSDDALITQIAPRSGAGSGQPSPGRPATATSSSTAPGLMALMLEALDISDGMNVLEIGTGTGYNAALLCHRLGSTHVTSIDIDANLVTAADARLRGIGYTPRLHAGDGMIGYPPGAPYERIIATVGVPEISRAWIDQTAENGRILANLYRPLGGGALALLTVTGNHAEGRFLPDYGGFMPLRQLHISEALALVRAARHTHYTQRPTSITGQVLDDEAFAFLAALLIPAQRVEIHSETRPAEFWLIAEDGSSACQTTAPDGPLVVNQRGPRRLWDDLEEIRETWTALGAPPRQDFSLTIGDDGAHTIRHASQPGFAWPLRRS